MEMEVDEGTAASNVNKNAIFVCCLRRKGGLKRTKLPVNFSELSFDALKAACLTEVNSWEWPDPSEKPENIDILHRSRTLKTDDDVKKLTPLSVVSIIKRDANPSKHVKSEKFIADYAASRNIHDQLIQVAVALRTAFFNPKFITMIENLGNSDMMENIFAIAPELQTDPVTIGIIQDPTLIFHLSSDPDTLKKLANVRPWAIEAFNFLAASIHQEKGSASPQGIPNDLFNPVFDGEDESMEEGDDDDSPGPSRGIGARITREQLSAALSALGGGGLAQAQARGPGGPSSSNAFGGLFQPSQGQSAAAPAPNSGVAAAGANIQNLMNTLAGAGGGVPGQPLNSDIVARAVTDALRRLTPEQRADQFSAIRNFASQLQQQASPNPPQVPAAPPQTQPQTPAVQPQASSTARDEVPGSLQQQYQSQLRQMAEMGITDQRLSILALRVSEGDVNTAVELIFSGWQGEGSDPLN